MQSKKYLKEIQELEIFGAVLRKQSEELVQQINDVESRISMFKAARSKYLLGELPDSPGILSYDPSMRVAQQKFFSNFTRVFPSMGYYESTGQIALSIKMYLQDSEAMLSVAVEELRRVIPYLVPDPETGKAYMGIRESTLSEFGSYNIHITPQSQDDNIFEVVRGKGKGNVMFKTMSLVELVKFIRDNYWYAEKINGV